MLRQTDSTRSLIIRKRQATFFGHVMRREKLDHHVPSGMIEGKLIRRKQREKMLDEPTKCLKVGRATEALKATRARDAKKVMIASATEHVT